MGIMNDLEKVYENGLVVIARRVPVEKIGKCAQAILKGGCILMESTFDQTNPNCIEENKACIKEIIKATDGKMLVGAGTVLNIEQVRAAYEAGARYIISPNVNADVIKETKRLGMLSFPGGMTPTEIEYAYSLGADMVKLFPADDLGYHYIQNLKGPLAHIPLMATGGVNAETILQYKAVGIKAYGTGISILKPELIEKEDYEAITQLTKEHMDAIKL